MAYASVEQLAAGLRVRVTAENQDALQRCLDAAAEEIDADLDRLDPFGVAVQPLAVFLVGVWKFSESTPPPVGRVYMDTPPMVLVISQTDNGGLDQSAPLASLITGDQVLFQEVKDSTRYTPLQVLTDASYDPVQLAYTVQVEAVGPAFAGPRGGEQVQIAADHAAMPEPSPEPGSGVPAVVVSVNIARAVEWWKANDAAYGIIGFEDTGAIRAPRDGFARHAQSLTPWKQQWGVA